MKRLRLSVAVLLAATMLMPGIYYHDGNISGYSDIADDDSLCLPVQLLKNAHIMWGYG
ncbi:MAG: hypothetical protein IJ297_08090 [Clostridia bacterium]|nr:hypothetical protein [Clostridia bacterium]